jgi:hypothetical protein
VSNNSDFDLLADIARLLKKYGPEAFERLAENLSSPEFLEHLVTILKTSTKAGMTANIGRHTRKKKQSSADFRSSLTALDDKEKAELLLKFYDGLMSKTLLPTLRSLQSFISDAGLPPSKTKVREKAIIQAIRTLRALSLDELKSILSTVSQAPLQDDRSLEGWSNIILNKKRPSNLKE